MKILFVTMVWPKNKTDNMYSDLMSEFAERGHSVRVAALSEKRDGISTHVSEERGMRVLYIKCGNIQKVSNKYMKVISSFIAGIALFFQVLKNFGGEKFECIIFALPPLTIAPFITALKHIYKTKLYLLLKEFWPQDPVDLGGMKKYGIVWLAFRILEKSMYRNSDYIGTMSKAGITFLQETNPKLKSVLEVCPNSQKFRLAPVKTHEEIVAIRAKYGIPTDKCVFVFGGNLGLSQGIPEMIEEINAVKDVKDAFFLIIGSGTEYKRVCDAFASFSKDKIAVIPFVPRDEFDDILCCCDVGLIFLYPKYTVPNVPSRLVSYTMAGLPILAAVDSVTDVGNIIHDSGSGIGVLNGDIEAFRNAVIRFCDKNVRADMSYKSRKLYENIYTTKKCYETIFAHFNCR